ncbi:hypothetical protein GCM10018783_12140 [Streptomyces griseosporeus]|nr:hypothetical protein GCM10018783_12140 [Streptomyces griseosporeus]
MEQGGSPPARAPPRPALLPVQDNEIVKVTSPHDDPVTHGNLCSKGGFSCRHVRNRDGRD